MDDKFEGRPLSMMRSYRIPLIAASVALSALGGMAPVVAQDNGASAPASQWVDNIAAFASSLRGEITRLPPDSASEAYEAAILFLAEQSEEPDNVICAAIDVVQPEATTPANAQAAMANFCRRLLGRRGTGAIPNAGTGFSASSFSAPIISTGGGSSGYTP